MKNLDSKNLGNDHGNVKSRGFLLSILFSVILIGISGIAFIRSNSELIFPSSTPEVSKADAEKFCNAVLEGKEKEAILIASKIIPDDSPELPNPDFIYFFSENGLGTLMLTTKFNHFDYLRWKDAYEMQKIVYSYNDDEEPLELFFKKIISKKSPHVKGKSLRKKPYVSLLDIYKSKNACVEELTRLFSEFAYQSGYEVQVVYFYDENRTLLYMVCELRKNDKVYIADLIYGKLFKDISVDSIPLNPEKFKNIWPETLIKSIKWEIYNLPAEPMDYRLFNMYLNLKLKKLGLTSIPRFGENPKFRIEEYLQKYSKNSENKSFSYWNFPIKSLKSSSKFPEEWKLPMEKRIESDPDVLEKTMQDKK